MSYSAVDAGASVPVHQWADAAGMVVVCPFNANQCGTTSGEPRTAAERESSCSSELSITHSEKKRARTSSVLWFFGLTDVYLQQSELQYKHYLVEVEQFLKQDPHFSAKMENSSVEDVNETCAC